MDTEKTIQFILEHQAQFAVQQQQLTAQQQQFRQDLQDLTGLVHRVAELQLQQQQQIGRHEQEIGGLTQIVRELAEGQRHTDERLNALIKIVDDLVRRDGSRI